MGFISRLSNWMKRHGSRGMWLFVTVFVLGTAAVGVNLLNYPIIPFKPICIDNDRPWFLPYVHTLDGELKQEFVDAMVEEFRYQGIPFGITNHGELTVSIRYLLAIGWDVNVTGVFESFGSQAVDRIIERRLGTNEIDRFPSKIYSVPHPRIANSWYDTSECPTMRAIAMMPAGVDFFFPEDDPFWIKRLAKYHDEIRAIKESLDQGKSDH